jgi:hypothetical protein
VRIKASPYIKAQAAIPNKINRWGTNPREIPLVEPHVPAFGLCSPIMKTVGNLKLQGSSS